MRRISVVTASLFLIILLAGCSADRSGSLPDRSGSLAARSESSVKSLAGERTQKMTPGAASTGNSDLTTVATGDITTSQKVTTGSISVTVQSPSRAADATTRLVEAAGGHVDDQQEQAPVGGAPATATLTLRIPFAKLSETLNAIVRLGALEERTRSTKDVTAAVQDLSARTTALRESVDRLTQLMTSAATTADLITIESALSLRQASLESLEAQSRVLGDQVDFATITVTIGTAEAASAHAPANFIDGVASGWRAFVIFFAGAIVVVGVLIPWIIALGIVATIAFLIVSRVRRARDVPEVNSTS